MSDDNNKIEAPVALQENNSTTLDENTTDNVPVVPV